MIETLCNMFDKVMPNHVVHIVFHTFQQIMTNHDGKLTFDEFLKGIRGELSPARQDVVNKAFAKMDKDGSGVISPADMKGVYSAAKHPKFISGEKTEE